MNDNALKILSIIENNGGEARFVGGAVRDRLAGRQVKDIDIATTFTPEKVTELLEGFGITIIPTGINFGTVTALIHGETFEITTLRKDVSTDGRHAEVSYTNDWQEDASRRDFTMNALYESRDGEVFDYFNGIADIEAGVLRFIGEPEKRIEEDYLRILRLFRFQVLFGKAPIMPDALQAVEKLKAGLDKISGERIRTEMLKILAQKNQYEVLQTMFDLGLLSQITTLHHADFNLPATYELSEDKQINIDEFNPIMALCVLLESGISEEKITVLATRWRLSNKEKNFIFRLQESLLLDFSNEYQLRRSCRINGKDEFYDYILLNYYKGRIDADAAKRLIKFAAEFAIPEFPLSGNMLIASGFRAGKELGQKLKAAEQYWEENNYKPDSAELLKVIGG
jgi:poly(A) polymerase